MDALWSLEDKLKISTPVAATLLGCSFILVVGICIGIFRVGRKGRNRVGAEVSRNEDQDEDWDENENESTFDSRSSCNRELLVKDVLSESGQWSKARRWEDGPGVVERWRWWWRMRTMMTASRWRRESRGPPVWQRPILMGEKCELPKFSGLILYDENGHPLSE